ncbi:hypothetical protein ISG33_13890 [Glaciecola sp. MH2013]|uniref:hypothetical protein n=1 Tax=Glaciecola sp. MH2013 TaxID=2785524 RepID=UPI0018A0EE2E|nr:hypothetical protein [Glaciecola sp. MH2013]MBF7074493.1 hypothetical protein [Glaciecola sp. MH2013]
MFSSSEDITATTKEELKNNNQKLISKLIDRSLEFMKFGVKKRNKAINEGRIKFGLRHFVPS